MARTVFYDPHLAALGGGEKYLLTILEHVAQVSTDTVELISPSPSDPSAWRRLGIEVDPDRVQWRQSHRSTEGLPRTWELSADATRLSAGADLFLALSNFVPPRSHARRSAVIIQFPFRDFTRVAGIRSRLWRLTDRKRLKTYDTVICYSQFVQKQIEARLEIPNAITVEPPVDLPSNGESLLGGRRRIVLAVGRFSADFGSNNKKHELIIGAWRQFLELAPAGWELHLAGGLQDDLPSQTHFDGLRRLADGLPIHFHPNASLTELKRLYATSSIFWHAAGHRETEPQRFEHFGITTVEAMAHGCVPIVPPLGGQPEIVEHGVTGYFWHSVDELVALTRYVIQHPSDAQRVRSACIVSARRFSKQRFVDRVREHLLIPAGVVEVS